MAIFHSYVKLPEGICVRPHRSQKIPREDPTIGLGFLRRSHEILIPSVPLAGWDVAFAAQARLDRRREMEMFSNDINV